jgi:cyclase
MHRRAFVRSSAFTLGALSLLSPTAFARMLQDPAWKIKMLTKEIGIFTEKGGTILFMISNKGIVVVDSQFPDSAAHLIGELKKKSPETYSLLINTHHHGDHTAGNIAFKGLVPHVLAHANSKINQEAAAKKQNTEDKQLYPDQTYTEKWCEQRGKEKICLHYFGAAHTNGDSLVHFQHSNILHMGDLVFNRRHPYVDKSAGADMTHWMEVLEKATKTFDKKTQYVCGHSGDGYDVLLKTDDLLMFRDYLGNVLNFTKSQLALGKTKEEILKATEIPGSPQWKGDGIQRPLTAAIEELSGQ